MKQIEEIPVKANFALAEEWEPAIDAGIRVWLESSSIGDRRKLIRMFNAMLALAPEVTNKKDSAK